MPTINLNNNQTTPTTTPAAQTPAPNIGSWNDPWQDDSDDSTETKSQVRMTPQERVSMIEKVYLEVLGRNPDTRDINYYKYSTLSEDEIKKQLLTGNEHKQLLIDGRDYKKVKDRALQAETRVKLLEGQIVDQVEEFKELTNLLKEKNRHISELREKVNDTKGVSSFSPKSFQAPQKPEETSSIHFTTQGNSEIPKRKEVSLIDRVRKTLKDML